MEFHLLSHFKESLMVFRFDSEDLPLSFLGLVDLVFDVLEILVFESVSIELLLMLESNPESFVKHDVEELIDFMPSYIFKGVLVVLADLTEQNAFLLLLVVDELLGLLEQLVDIGLVFLFKVDYPGFCLIIGFIGCFFRPRRAGGAAEGLIAV